MSNDNVVRLIQPGAFEDRLTEVLRSGARALLAQAAQVMFKDAWDQRLAQGKAYKRI